MFTTDLRGEAVYNADCRGERRCALQIRVLEAVSSVH